MKRLSWFVAGAAAGVAGTEYARHKARRAADRYKPAAVARATATRVRVRGRDLVEALREGRHAMREKEAELIAYRDGTLEPDDGAGARVIVLETVPAYSHPAGPRRRSRR